MDFTIHKDFAPMALASGIKKAASVAAAAAILNRAGVEVTRLIIFNCELEMSLLTSAPTRENQNDRFIPEVTT